MSNPQLFSRQQESLSELLTATEWSAFLAGVCHARTGVDTSVILPFLRQVQATFAVYSLPLDNLKEIEHMVYDGRLGQAHLTLAEMVVSAKKAESIEDREDPMVAKDLQEVLDKEVDTQKETEASLNCQSCGVSIESSDLAVLECGHILHRICVRHIVDSQLSANDVSLNCPICHEPLQRQDLMLCFAKGEVDQIERRQKKRGDVIMHCPSLGCRFKGKWTVEQFFFCSECEKYYCLICCSELPPNESTKYHLCRGATREDEVTYGKLCAGQEIKQCAKCGYWNEVNKHRLSCMCGMECCTLCLAEGDKCECNSEKGWKSSRPVGWFLKSLGRV